MVHMLNSAIDLRELDIYYIKSTRCLESFVAYGKQTQVFKSVYVASG